MKRDLLADILGEQEESAAAVDFDEATIQRIADMNPALLAGRTPEEFARDMKLRAETATKRQSERTQAKAAPEGSFALPADVDQLVIALEKRYQLEKKEIEEEIKRLSERQRSLKPRYRDTFMDKLLEIDANLVSPKTHFILKEKKTFLDEVGFTVETFVAHGRRRRTV
jgi:predicted transcriptional regulator